jgi:hypothetical protein
MNTTRYYAVAALVSLSIIGVVGAAYGSGLLSAGTSSVSPLANALTRQATVLPGDPPIPVSTGEATRRETTVQTGVPSGIPLTIVDAGPNEPSFTEADVRKYVAEYIGDFGKIEVESGTAQLTGIEFLTVAALRQKLGETSDLQLADQAPICQVEYSGHFFVESPVRTGSNPTFNHVSQVFDAHTGNLLTISASNTK